MIKVFWSALFPLLILCGITMAGTEASGYIPLDGDSIYYEVSGSGPALVLIHDGMVDSQIWKDQVAYFSKKYRVVTYDRRGYGKSSAATGSSTRLDALTALFNYLKIEKAAVIGMSAGGRLAINFTLVHPEKVSSLMLVGAVVQGFPYTEHFRRRGRHLPENLRDDKDIETYYINDDPYEMYKENKATKERVAHFLEARPRKGHGAESGFPAGKSAVERLGEISVPTLILVGEYDIPDVHAHAGAINAGIKDSIRKIVYNSGHLIPVEQPEEFNKIVDEFLNGAKTSANEG